MRILLRKMIFELPNEWDIPLVPNIRSKHFLTLLLKIPSNFNGHKYAVISSEMSALGCYEININFLAKSRFYLITAPLPSPLSNLRNSVFLMGESANLSDVH